MSDIQLMSNLMNTQPEHDILFKDVQIRDLNDENKGDYSAGQINFNTKNASKSYTALAQDDLLIPFTISVQGILSASNCLGTVTNSISTITGPATVDANGYGGGPSNTGGTLSLGSRGSVAFKHSVLSLINGCDISLNNGGSGVVSDLKNISLINQIRMMVQNNQDWATTYAPEFAFAKDSKFSIPNDGFNTRQGYLYDLSNCTYYNLPGVAAGTTTGYISSIQALIKIPLKFIHNFFANLDFPSRGIEWLINFHMCKEFNPNQKYSGFCFAEAVPSGVRYQLGKANVAGVSYNSCKIKYKVITLPDKFQLSVNKHMASGDLAKRYVKFAATEVYDDITNFSGDLSSYKVASGIVKPIRLWLLGFDSGSLKSQITTNTTHLALKTLNVEINTENRFSSDLNSPYDFYSQVKDQMQELANSPDRGSLINYLDFYQSNPSQFDNGSYGLYSFYCVDLAHTQSRVDDESLSIIINSLKASGTVPLDYVVLVEREVTAKFEFSGNNCTIVIGSQVE